MVYFVGAGSGAPDLITVRGARLLNQADQIIYAGSLVNPELLDYKKESAVVYDSAKMTLEEVVEKIQEAESTGKMTVRLHTGDPCVYGAIREQMDELDKLNISYKVCPGVSSFCGAASALNLEYTLPDNWQTLELTYHPDFAAGDYHPDGGADAGAGAGEHRVVCSASCDYGYIFKHGNAEEAFGRADKGRI